MRGEHELGCCLSIGWFFQLNCLTPSVFLIKLKFATPTNVGKAWEAKFTPSVSHTPNTPKGVFTSKNYQIMSQISSSLLPPSQEQKIQLLGLNFIASVLTK